MSIVYPVEDGTDHWDCEAPEREGALISHTRQEWFELAVRGLAKQGWEQSMATGYCAYRGVTGCCAIGFGIPDADYNPRWDTGGKSVAHLVETDIIRVAGEGLMASSRFLLALQVCHDIATSPGDMRWRMYNFCITHNLTWPADVAREGEIK